MRKEVKLGMALGGGLVALLIAYLIVAPPSDHKRGVQLVDGDGSIIDAASQQQQQQQPSEAAVTPVSDEAKVAAAEPVKAEHALPQQPSEQPKVAPKGEEKAVANRPAGRDPWERPLNGEPSPAPAGASSVKTKPVPPTPTVAEAPKAPEPAAPKQAEKRPTKVAAGDRRSETVPLFISNPNDAYNGGLNDVTAAVERAVGGSSTGGRAPAPKMVTPVEAPVEGGSEIGSTAATPTAGSTHVVRSGETFSSIAQTVYGSAAYYPHLIRANPHANPNNLKLGTAIVIPKVEDVKAAGGSSAERSGGPVFKVAEKAADDVKIDPVKQYRVQSGDSLYKISIKKFGTPNYVEAIYEKNRQTIGANPTRLKLGMILEMPEKTAVTSSDPRSALGDGTTGGGQH